MPVRPRTPKYRLHKGSGQALVELGGRRHYLGKFGSPESKQRYQRLVAEWLLNDGKPTIRAHASISIDEIAAHYLTSVNRDRKYRRSDGSASTRLGEVKVAIRHLRQDHGLMKAADFTVADLRLIQQRMKDQKLKLTTINGRIAIIKQLFRHAATHELIPAQKYETIGLLDNLVRGQCPDHEPEKVECVPDEHIQAIKLLVPKPVWGLIQVQLYSAARPGELVRLRVRDIDRRTDDLWFADLAEHKTAHHGKKRRLMFGPRCQHVLKEFLPTEKPLDAPVFSSLDAKTSGRQDGSSPQREAPQGSNRVPTGFYRVDSYRRAIQRACKIAKVPVWSPHQLRHSAATRIRQEEGIEAAQVILGHSSIKTTEIYAEPNLKAAMEIAAKVG